MATTPKDIIYIDVDDEITAIIDKLRSSDGRIVALVLPKRATVLQSIVNMKLLKRTADAAKKHVVLITAEASLLPLAGAVGMHVASSLQSKPVIPTGVPSADSATDANDDFNVDEAADKPIGSLAGAGAAGAATGAAASRAADTETIELDNDTAAAAAGAGLAAGAGKAGAKAKKDKKLAIPDFNKFRLALIAGGVLFVGLLIFLYFAVFVLPKATVTIATDSSDIRTNATVTLSPGADELDLAEGIVPAKTEQKQQTGAQQVSSTGEKNKGEKAGGSVVLTLKNCDADEVTVPSGTGVSSGGQTYITQSSVELGSVIRRGSCDLGDPAASGRVDVVAQKAGASYNIGPSEFTVAGFSNVTGKSTSAMTGGTDNIVKSVTQSDIDNAKQKINAGDSASVRTDLRSKLQSSGYTPIPSSLHASEPVVTTSANVGDESDTVTVTQATTYTMYGVKKADIRALILENVKDKIDPKKQKVLNDGTGKVTYDISAPAAGGNVNATISAVSLAGPDIDTKAIKSAIKGKKTNDVRTIIKSTPGVTDVSVKYSPFWVTKVPNKESKITIIMDKADASGRTDDKQ